LLGDDAIARYARQIVVPGIGATGQERLLAAVVLVVGHERGAAQAALYLTAAGTRVTTRVEDGPVDLVVAAEAAHLDVDLRRGVHDLGLPICWYSLDEAGFTSGVTPDAPLPEPQGSLTTTMVDPLLASRHDAAACDVATLACAIVIGLPHRRALANFRD